MTIPRGYLAARASGAMLTGGESAEQRAYGDFLSKDELYARTAEFLDIVTSL